MGVTHTWNDVATVVLAEDNGWVTFEVTTVDGASWSYEYRDGEVEAQRHQEAPTEPMSVVDCDNDRWYRVGPDRYVTSETRAEAEALARRHSHIGDPLSGIRRTYGIRDE